MKYKKEVCETYGIRMSRKDKKSFRDFISNISNEMGYENKIEKNMFAKNIVVGNPETAEYIITAHYDTPPRLPKFFVKHMLLHSFVTLPAIILGLSLGVPELLLHSSLPVGVQTTGMILSSAMTYFIPISMTGYLLGFMGGANKTNFNDNSSGCLALLNLMEEYKNAPEEIKNKICFVFFDNEEKALLGSLSYANKHKNEIKNQTIINMDCIGKGEQINLYHFGKPTKIVEELQSKLKDNEFITAPKKSNLMSMSDHFPFRKSNHVCLLNVDKNDNKSLFKQIHSSADTSLDNQNIDHIVDKITTLPNINLKQEKSLNIINEMFQTQIVNKINDMENIDKPQKPKEKVKIKYETIRHNTNSDNQTIDNDMTNY